MKKILIATLVLFMFNIVSGQKDTIIQEKNRFLISLNFGGNLSIPYAKEYLALSVRDFKIYRTHSAAFGYFGEFQLNYLLSEKLFFIWNLGYSQTNQDYSSSKFFDNKLRQYAVYNNLMVNYCIPKFQLYFGLGIYYNYNFKIIEESTFNGKFITPDMLTNPNGEPVDDPLIPSNDEPFITDLAERFNSNEFGLVAEIGKRFTISKKLKINSFVRYNQSVINIVPDNMNFIYYNMYVSVGIGLMY